MIVCDCVRQLGEEIGSDALVQVDEQTPLMGEGSGIDSIALVSLIVEIETRVSEEMAVELVLADDRAMSSSQSPFRKVGIFTDYIESLVREQKKEA